MDLTNEMKLEMFWTMLLARRLDERAWMLHRQGRIDFHISGIGQEAAQVGAAFALKRGYDWIAPYYRDLALMIAVGYSPRDFALSMMGKKEEPGSGGRQMPSHWGLRSANVISHSAPVATQCVHAAGVGLAIKMRKEDKVVFTSLGEGSTSQGEWYEAVNWAAVHQLPVIFMVENNQYAISESVDKQMAVPSAADKACGLGLPGVQVDGTDLFKVYTVVKEAVDNARAGKGPKLIEAKMYRITPHSSDDDDRSYRTREEVDTNKLLDPMIVNTRNLMAENVLTQEKLDEMEVKAKSLIDEAIEYASKAPFPDLQDGMHPVYAEEVTHA
jgi:2-oxoisovalerate dehydrogenase E1 component alpha subunit